MSRLATLPGRAVDVAIIGGGIIGAGIARDAALRGLSVALFEQHDYGSGTTAGSTRLIHGGLRYLELLDFRLVRLDLRERETLLRNAPHLVRPLPFLLPFYGTSWLTRLKMHAGMLLYDTLSFDKRLPRHRMLAAGEVAAAEPELSPQGLQGAAAYFDAQAPLPERLCLENILAARARGALTFNYVSVTGATREGSRVTGVRVRDALTGEETRMDARTTVNAAGPWLDRVAQRIEPDAPTRLRTTQGIHLATPALSHHALALTSRVDGRLVFVIPWLGQSWIGTTDTDFVDDPSHAHATPDDVDYLLRSVQPYLPRLRAGEIHFTRAGVRALVREPGSPSSVSRLHQIVDGRRIGTPGLVSVVGGKLTAYRAIAEETVDLVCDVLGVDRPSMTAHEPLPGAREDVRGTLDGLSDSLVEHLQSIYGVRARAVARLIASDPALAAPLAEDRPDVVAQVVLAAREEQCVRLSDFMWRRTSLGFSADQGQTALTAVASGLARELGWSDVRRDDEIRRYLDAIRATAGWSTDGERPAARGERQSSTSVR